MKNIISLTLHELQMFAEGAGDAGAEGATGVTATDAVSQETGVKEGAPAAEDAQTAAEPPIDRNAEFKKLIKGEYKDAYSKMVNDTVRDRLKGTKETVDKFNSLTPALELLAGRYGVEVGDVSALVAAIEEDNSFFEAEAYEKGMSVEELKRVRKLERENNALKQQMEEQASRERAAETYREWLTKAEEVKQTYPAFDLEAELANPRFVDLLRSHIDMRTAFEVLHKDEIIPAAMQYTAKQVEQQVVNKIKANGARPQENGLRSQSSSLVGTDVSKLTRAQRAELNREILRGRRVSFTK